MWSFVRQKSNKRWKEPSAGGIISLLTDDTSRSRLLWLALCKQTRQVVACVIGGRGVATCRQLWQAVPDLFKQGICFSDFWEAYEAIIPTEQHQAVSKKSGLTAHVERFNNTLRQRLSRFVRKSLSFSKSDDMHLICLHLFLHRYNLERLESIR